MNGQCIWCGEWDIDDTHHCRDQHVKMFNGFSTMTPEERLSFMADLEVHFCLKCGKCTDCRCED